MLIAFISDIHGNFISLKLLLKELKRKLVEKTYFLGDAVGYFPDGDSVILELDRNKIDCILGNHDAMGLGYLEIDEDKDKIYLNKKQKQSLSPKSYNIFGRWVPFKIETIESFRVLLVHGSPFNPLAGYIYPDSNIEKLCDLDFDVIVMGHTHRPFYIFKNNKHLVNAGSVGLPRDFGDQGSYILWDTTDNSFKIERFPLPIEEILEMYSSIHDDVKHVLRRNYT